MPERRLTVPEESEGLRLDQCLARHIPELSRRSAKLALDLGCVFVNRRRVKTASRRVQTGDQVVAHLGGAFQRALAGEDPAAQLPVPDVLFEDPHMVVVLKPAGLLTAPTPEGDRNNLLHTLEHASDGATASSGGTPRRRRLFVVHRLDLQTSGVLVLAKSREANQALSEAFRRHDLVRQYDAFVGPGFPHEALRIDAPVAGRPAVTHVRRVESTPSYTQLEATLETGRTHQIRRHLLGLGFAVLSDPEYGERQRSGPPRLALHAKRLAFRHPIVGSELDFSAPLPADLAGWLERTRPVTSEAGQSVTSELIIDE